MLKLSQPAKLKECALGVCVFQRWFWHVMTMHYSAYEILKIIMKSKKSVINTDSYVVINNSIKKSILQYLLKPHYEWSFLPVENYFKVHDYLLAIQKY